MLPDRLQHHGISIGRDKLFDLLAGNNMLIRKRKRRKAITTNSNHPFRKYPNLTAGVEACAANHIWVSDITYLSLPKGRFCYLSLITDVYSRKIVGYNLCPTLHREGPLTALKMALETRNKSVFYKTIHHSDRGIQYCSKDYIELLTSHGISISMTENGEPAENAIAERVNGILKAEFTLDKQFPSYYQASKAVDAAVITYNELRLHLSCGYLTPDQAYKQASGKLPKLWKKRKSRVVSPKQNLQPTLQTDSRI
jgi:putative transposase